VEEPELEADPYQLWIRTHDTITEADRRAILDHVSFLPVHPLISVVMPTYNAPASVLTEAIASVQAQLYPCWELCIADDASTAPHVASLLDAAARRDGRIKVIHRPSNGHISAATNSALELATGDFVALMDHDDILPEHALYEVAVEINAHPDADVIYSDEDQIDQMGRRSAPYFKPDWNPELLLGLNLISHLGVYRRSLIMQLGGLREGLEGSQDYDLALRATDATTPDRIRHIPAVLYHWRRSAQGSSFSELLHDRCIGAARRAIRDHLDRRGHPGATVAPAPLIPYFSQVTYPVPEPEPLVSVIIPTRDHADLLHRTCDGILHETDYRSVELIVVDNDSREAPALSLLRRLAEDPRVTVLSHPGLFNYSAMNNAAARIARGEILALLNNDLEVIEPGWLREMVSHSVRREVGAVGAKLLYPDGRVQHAGVVTGPNGSVAHLLRFAGGDDPGYGAQLALTRSLSAVTGACMVLRRSVFEEVGGLDEHLAVTFNDIDLCLRLRDHGYRIVWTPAAQLFHLESATRGVDTDGEKQARAIGEWEFMRRRWGSVLDIDPYHNPNIQIQTHPPATPSLPRRLKPWRRNQADTGRGAAVPV
jgi:GT2 family glycosyltransferase